ncbi:LacI family DNA-binding transcriptional regulator [Kineococcus radiotolerans]|uniref:Alanine racemase n=1 Tax=Kineococcus radiotolerans (strain ATCC BAA-149 / DSM 14245 / SRS30216) TaxID=266940 RepID=A6WB69_KINRD|nr:LacI family DNA-binding transcriptional regulator [Kineococcus radiotolerans]ABS04058.1 Alanine racemase [Kineococcus radiotolerans SRS30216 = ATCC BAA-149]
MISRGWHAPTLQDVARVAGVSARTVSNVVNDHPHVSPKLRARVRTAIAELDYRPAWGGRSLQSGQRSSDLLTLVVPDVKAAFYGELAHAVADSARRRGLRLLLEQTGGDLDLERDVVAHRVTGISRGLIFAPIGVPVDLLRRQRDLPVVLIGEHGRGSPLDHVYIDSVEIGRLATQHLIDRGRRRIAFLGAQGAQPHTSAVQRLEGYRQALHGAGLVLSPDTVRELPAWDEAGGFETTTALIAEQPAIDALVVGNDAAALGALRALRSLGRTVPADVAVVGIDDIRAAAYASPPLTTVALDRPAMADFAVSLITDTSPHTTVDTGTDDLGTSTGSRERGLPQGEGPAVLDPSRGSPPLRAPRTVLSPIRLVVRDST